jgi:glycosyltransferase involved in cell wall biosynthesis
VSRTQDGDGAGRPRRIVITRRATLDFRDGINIFIFALSDALIEAGHDVTVLATRVGDPDHLRALYAPRSLPELHAVEPRPTRLGLEGLTPGWLRRGRHWIRRLDPDLVINNGVLPFGTPGRTCNLAHDLGWATTARKLDRLRTWYKRYAYGRGDEIIALAPEVARGLSGQLDVDLAAIRVIPPCVPAAARVFRPTAEREDLIVHTGTQAYKDPSATIRAFAALTRTSTRLVVEGDVTDELAGQVAALPAPTRTRIELVGALPAAGFRDLLGSARVASFPTSYTVPTASATVVEAIVAGTPIAGSGTLSASVLQPEGNGIACRDDRELTAAYERLLSDDEGWDRMSAAALAMAPGFHADAVAAAYLGLLDGRTG